MSLLEQGQIRIKQVNKLLALEPELNAEDNNKYDIETIFNSKVYTKRLLVNHLDYTI